MATITSQQLTALGDNFLAFAQAVGNYRMENRALLSDDENQQVRSMQRTLLNYADDLFTTSAILVMDETEDTLDKINEVTTDINKTYHKLQNVQKAINVAGAGVTLGAAIFSKNPQAIAGAVKGLVHSWKEEV